MDGKKRKRIILTIAWIASLSVFFVRDAKLEYLRKAKSAAEAARNEYLTRADLLAMEREMRIEEDDQAVYLTSYMQLAIPPKMRTFSKVTLSQYGFNIGQVSNSNSAGVLYRSGDSTIDLIEAGDPGSINKGKVLSVLQDYTDAKASYDVQFLSLVTKGDFATAGTLVGKLGGTINQLQGRLDEISRDETERINKNIEMTEKTIKWFTWLLWGLSIGLAVLTQWYKGDDDVAELG